MAISIYTYSNPYEISSETYWESIKNCAHFCISQTMMNGMRSTYDDLSKGQLSTVDTLLKKLYGEWEGNLELYIEQYSQIDNIINNKLDLEKNIKASLKYNKKNIVDSLRLLAELDVEVNNIDSSKLSEEQLHVVRIYSYLQELNEDNKFQFNRNKDKNRIDTALKEAMKHKDAVSGIDYDKVVFHGIHQFSPMILMMIEEISKCKDVILLFNYQKQYKNIYQTWIDIYSLFGFTIGMPNGNEFKSSPIFLPTSYEGNLLADKLAKLVEGEFKVEEMNLENIEVVEFDNITEFANYVADVFERAKEKKKISKDEKKSTLYYMDEQFYAADSSVNDILKVYFPEQFGERHFLAYPIGRFFIAISDMWDMENGGLIINDMSNIIECLNSGILPESIPGELVNTFNLTKVFFEREITIKGIIEKLELLARTITRMRDRNSRRQDKSMEDILRLNYFNVTEAEIEKLVFALSELDTIANLFYKDFEQEDNNFKEFYSRVKKFIQDKIENRMLSNRKMEEEFKDILMRLLNRLEDADDIKVTGTFECLKETMGYYFKQESNKDKNAEWIVRDFEQIDGDVLISRRQEPEKIYHFCCLSDSNMNLGEEDRLPWPLDNKFFELAYEPYDWKYQVFVKSMKELKNFKKYAIVYGLQFNMANYKLSYIKSEDNKINEMYYLFRILGLKKKVKSWHCYEETKETVESCINEKPQKDSYLNADYYKWNICTYRFVLESIVEGGVKHKEKFIILKYLEIILEMKVCEELSGKMFIESDLMESLDSNYEKIIKRFKSAIDLDKIDIINNSRNFIIERLENNRFPKFNDEYMAKKKEFIYLKINSDDRGDENILKSKLLIKVEKEKLDKALNYDKLAEEVFETSVNEWCKYCSNKEICLGYYRAIGN